MMLLPIMIPLEQEVKKLLDEYKVPYNDYGTSGEQPDLHVQLSTGRINIELKEKRQPYASSKWPLLTRELDSFIIDEFTVRKMMTHAPLCVLIVRDNTTGLYYFADIYTLVFMERKRCNREMNWDKRVVIKGKWCLDLNNFDCYDNLLDVFRAIKRYHHWNPIDPSKGVECWNEFKDENIELAGEARTEEQREYDVEATR